MYQAQQEAELDELQNRENVKKTLPISQIAIFCLLGDNVDSALKTKRRFKQITVLVFCVENCSTSIYRMGRQMSKCLEIHRKQV